MSSDIFVESSAKARATTTVGVVVTAVAAALYFNTTRTFITELQSTVTGAIGVYASAVFLVLYCYRQFLGVSEWRGGGVTGILRSAEGETFHKQEVKNLVNGYYDNFGEESR
jgi:hypothetical protein